MLEFGLAILSGLTKLNFSYVHSSYPIPTCLWRGLGIGMAQTSPVNRSPYFLVPSAALIRLDTENRESRNLNSSQYIFMRMQSILQGFAMPV